MEYLHTEISEPKRKILRSNGSFYLMLLIGCIGCILLSRWLSNTFQTMRLLFQILLYVILIGTGYLVYKYQLVSYRYTLTNKELTIEQLSGTKQRTVRVIPIDSILAVGDEQPERQCTLDERAFIGKASAATVIIYNEEGEPHKIRLSMSDHLKSMLMELKNG